MKNTQITLSCKKCGKRYKVKKYRKDTSKYCSKKCWSVRNPPEPRKCKWCKKEFDSRDKRAKFCSKECAHKWRSKYFVGEMSPAWKGGKSSETTRGKLKGELKKWRNAIYKRDNYTCQKCNTKGVELHAHHIRQLHEYPNLALDINNGITLCVPCHEKEHGRKLSTPARYKKECSDCGSKTTGRSKYCRSCSIKRSWKEGRHSTRSM